MSWIDELPVPDWGLECPRCGGPLAGAPSFRCRLCGHPFNIRQILARHRPIPDVGLSCPNCGYSLTGLTGSRCPECGVRFSLRAMLADEPPAILRDRPNWVEPSDHHLKRREPTFTGCERPLPDFGLICALCDQPLAGAVENRCPACGDPFELVDFAGNRDWVVIDRYAPHFTSNAVRAVLYGSRIPYLADVSWLGNLCVPESCVRVPREFFFDALFALQQALEPPADFARQPWTCPNCRQSVPKGFEICWNCGESHPLAEGSTGQEVSQ